MCGADNTLMVARGALHEWEEPCISVGAGSGTVFFSNCPLRCVYCQNKPIAHRGEGIAVTCDQLAGAFLDLQAQGAANINLVTGTHYLPWIVEALDQAQQGGLNVPIIWNTSGYETRECVQALAACVDVWLTDFKYASPSTSNASKRYSQATEYFDVAVAAIDTMVDVVETYGGIHFEGDSLVRGVVVRHLLLPGRLQDSCDVMRFVWERYGTRVLYSVMSQYTPFGCLDGFPELNTSVAPEDYHMLLDYMDSLGMEDYFWQDGDPASESFIPTWDGTGF